MTVNFCPVEVAFRQSKRKSCKDQMNVKDVNQCTVFWNKMIKGPDEKIMFSLFYTGIKRKGKRMTIVRKDHDQGHTL
jgi:hypothetical protein